MEPGQETERKLEKFRADFSALVKEESKIGMEHFLRTSHQENYFDPIYLSEEDMNIWGKIENDSLTTNEFFEYMAKTGGLVKSSPDGKAKSSRNIFAAFVADKASVIFGQREIEKIIKESKQK